MNNSSQGNYLNMLDKDTLSIVLEYAMKREITIKNISGEVQQKFNNNQCTNMLYFASLCDQCNEEKGIIRNHHHGSYLMIEISDGNTSIRVDIDNRTINHKNKIKFNDFYRNEIGALFFRNDCIEFELYGHSTIMNMTNDDVKRVQQEIYNIIKDWV